jgi:branched-chain amino acid transport system substrate-binding protein
MKRIVTAFALCLAALCLSVAAMAQDEIRLGVLSDLTGPTGDVGVPYAEGIKDAAAYLNGQGGVAGKKIALVQVDYAYNAQQALSAYKKFIAQDKIVALLGGAPRTPRP